MLETVTADRGCFRCRMLGGEDGRTLYIVANHYSGGGTHGVVLTQRVAVQLAAGATIGFGGRIDRSYYRLLLGP